MASKAPTLGGYDFNFVSDPPDALVCLLCALVAKDPQQMDCCGMVCCHYCIAEYKKGSKDCPGPKCKGNGNSFPDRRGDREIKSLKVKCNNHSKGCIWRGELRSLEEHLQNQCGFTQKPCLNECKEGGLVVKILCKDLKDHLTNECPRRQYGCPHCRESGEYEERVGKHLDECPEVILSCLNNGCATRYHRKHTEVHIRKCDYQAVPCKHAEIGCKVRRLRKDIKEHEENECLRRQYECPHCKETGEYQERTTTHLETCPQVKVSCPNHQCQVSIPRCEVSTHRSQCDYEPVPCKYAEVGCEERPLRKDLQKHEDKECTRRQYRCPHCKETGEYQERTITHLETCPQVKVPCPNTDNYCQVNIPRCEVSTYRSQCDYEPVPCKYAEIGCEERPLRKDFKKHEENECPRRQYECPHCEESGQYQERTTTHLETCPKVKVPCPNTKCPVFISRCEVSTHQSTTCDYEPVPCKYADVGCEEKSLRKDLEKHEANDKVHLQVALECVRKQKKDIEQQNEQIKNLQSEIESGINRAPFTFKLATFKAQKQDNMVRVYSPPFYTSKRGYKLCICVDRKCSSNNDSKDTHVSVHVYLMKGDNDDSLTWPFTGTVTIELLNQLENKNHHKEKVTFPADHLASKRVVDGEKAESGYGPQKFISHAELTHKPRKSCQYLKDGTLFFRDSVQVPDYKPWLE